MSTSRIIELTMVISETTSTESSELLLFELFIESHMASSTAVWRGRGVSKYNCGRGDEGVKNRTAMVGKIITYLGRGR